MEEGKKKRKKRKEKKEKRQIETYVSASCVSLVHGGTRIPRLY